MEEILSEKERNAGTERGNSGWGDFKTVKAVYMWKWTDHAWFRR